MPTHYIGITDFTCFEEVELMSRFFDTEEYKPADMKLHVGVMMSYKTLNNLPTKWADVFPNKESLAAIFSSNQVMNCLHYADYTNTDVTSSLTQAIAYGGSRLHAVQLDMVWPQPDEITLAMQASGQVLELILQINTEAMRQVGDTPLGVVRRLAEYDGLITHVLLDKSMGRGVEMDAEALLPYAEAIAEHYPHLGLVVAGGLGPDTMHLAAPLLRRFPSMSIDAQGQLRRSGSARDPIDWDRAADYIRAASQLFWDVALPQ